MLTIDGSKGEGGGQVLRSSLALSMVTGTPVRLEKVRAGRRKPGLMRQHLTALRAAAHICGAAVEGDAIGSSAVSFSPGAVVPGMHRFAVGTAGSATLVLQTILPALLMADGPSEVTLEGGTHNPMAPPFEFLQRAFLPLVNQMGPTVEVELMRPGFFPAGGGQFIARIAPARKLTPIDLTERGPLVSREAHAVVSHLPGEIAKRELKKVRSKMGWSEDECRIEQADHSPGPGNALMLSLVYEHVNEVFTSFGEVGRPAEAVANRAVQLCQRYLKSTAVAGEYLTDQLMLPLAIAGGGSFTSTGLSSHATTHIELIQRFLATRIETVAEDRGLHRITFSS
ncbi:MAG: RNA 3'-terminal phosphate cyclase [Phycisphaerales bacterium JB063]